MISIVIWRLLSGAFRGRSASKKIDTPPVGSFDIFQLPKINYRVSRRARPGSFSGETHNAARLHQLQQTR
jgi:hypothetical protein